MNVTSRESMWTIAGLSLMLLIGCKETQTTMQQEPPKLSMNPPSDKKLVFAPELEKKEKKKIEETNETKSKMPVKVNGGFVASESLKPVYFDVSRSQLSEEAQKVILDNVVWLKTQPPYLIEIVGIAD